MGLFGGQSETATPEPETSSNIELEFSKSRGWFGALKNTEISSHETPKQLQAKDSSVQKDMEIEIKAHKTGTEIDRIIIITHKKEDKQKQKSTTESNSSTVLSMDKIWIEFLEILLKSIL